MERLMLFVCERNKYRKIKLANKKLPKNHNITVTFDLLKIASINSEISSSNFHLKGGNITASNVDLSGKITATTGEVGGFSEMLSTFPNERWQALDMSFGLEQVPVQEASKTPFWGFFIGGFFLYVSYYGVDQSQAQRELSAPTLDDTKRSLVLNGLQLIPIDFNAVR